MFLYSSCESGKHFYCFSDSLSFTFILTSALIQYTQPMYVQREDPNSRKTIMKEMTRRARTMGEWPHIILFPEGTCTNRTCLIGFKQGWL